MPNIIRVGECKRCGICCLGCDKIIWTMIKRPSVEKRLIGSCSIWGTQERKDKGCDDYPQLGDRLLGKFCGYRFIDENGNDVTEYRKNPTLYIFTHPPIKIIRVDE